MTFLTPWTALFAAAAAVPLLFLLYFLKLRRRRLSIPSTLLWRQSYRDLQANAPFQRLRVTLLFLLQLALLLLLLVAAAEPVFKPAGPTASRLILLVDRSASMNTRDGPPDSAGAPSTRLDAARRAARRIVEDLGRGGRVNPVMIVAFGAQPQIVTGFESRRDVLLEGIDAIAPTDEEADLDAALQLAGAFASRGEADDGDPADVILVSDGGVAPPADGPGYALRAGRFRFVSVPATPAPAPGLEGNVGIVSFSARRDYDDPSQVLVFARLVNVGPEPVESIVTLLVDDVAGPIERVTIPAPDADADTDPDAGEAAAPGSASVRFGIELPRGAVLSVRHNTRDSSPDDDTAAVRMPPPARPRLVIVRESADAADPYLADLLAESDPREIRVMTRAAYEVQAQDPAELARRTDLLVFDGVAPSRLPALPSLMFGAAPPEAPAEPPSSPGGRRILSWQRQHPLMRHVALDTVVFAGAGGLRLPREATPLATGPDGPVIALVPTRAAPHVVVAFSLARSNWPTHVSVAVFLQNTLDYLTAARSGQTSIAARPGEPIEVRRAAGAARIVVTGPAEHDVDASALPEGPFTLPLLRRAGLYTVTGVQPPYDRIPVSVLSEIESDTRPRRSLLVNADVVTAGAASDAAPRGVWSWFVAAALGLAVLEWVLYCRLARGGV